MPVTYPLTELPKSMTALEVVDALNARCVTLVAEINDGKKMTTEQFAATVARTFEAALLVFLERLDDATRVRFEVAMLAQYRAEYCNR
ncbi:hypothetical protein D7D52_34735 [Nocardia yunnanensis]|uniref:Uncharacterized protein n=1 Tax=Nocardia yunnanensis TaxID=2382165 RepID=A0A386ZLG7_9NOCA|nr:hypothetical protein [Nocardia yunnanensis]AYF78130.1 hypothetical protein D7D52_34735 [Nocardia yunnanensis]